MTATSDGDYGKRPQGRASTDEIRARFDADVARFSKRDTGQVTTLDAPLVLELMSDAAARVSPHAIDLLDVGCGAGNQSLAIAERLPQVRVHLIDLSQPMLDAAARRLTDAGVALGEVRAGDVRELPLEEGAYDLIVGGAVFHHLREDDEWDAVFASLYRALRPGGSVWISDLVTQEHDAVYAMMAARYGAYLESLDGADFRQKVFDYIHHEDSPRPVTWQLDRLRQAGFDGVSCCIRIACSRRLGRGGRPREWPRPQGTTKAGGSWMWPFQLYEAGLASVRGVALACL